MNLIGQIVEERYRVEQELGSGAMGTVYLARHVRLGRPVAIKVLHDRLLADDMMRRRFEREARIAARLHHLNVVGVIDLGNAPDGRDLMVLEYAPGRCLVDLVGAPMTSERVVSLAIQMLRGLDHAHGAGLVHRDLKPENVIVQTTPDGEVPRIVDFGIAIVREVDGSIESRRLTTAGTVLGTPMYMSPEHARGEPLDHRSDLFALGVIMYQMLAGRPPFDGSAYELLVANVSCDVPSFFRRAGVVVDSRLEAFVRTLMNRDATKRFPSAHAALILLEALRHSVATTFAGTARGRARKTSLLNTIGEAVA